ncbi:hypothetical protein CesoFtcFv8_025213 [Champsocephalus esox]|uniref:AIG1-type G domain-containing protein n=1 Tax=Champsocephalus esox TaxID=159716 RepID=A0AAN8GGL9_9TELE|nr:hypothetical protein CesoFtcFv8_025213 [Champsocephalus esox]
MEASRNPQAEDAPGSEGTPARQAEGTPARQAEGTPARQAEGTPARLPELRLVVLGWRWPGKSLTGNTILGKEEFHLERAAEFCVKRETEVWARQVTVVDTPGWFSAQDTPPSYKQELRIEEHVSLFGERVWRHTVVVFTWAEVLRGISIERYIRREGEALQWVLERCRRRYFVINNCEFGEHPQVGRLLERVEKMVAEEGGFYHVEEEEAKEEANQNQNREGRELGARPKQSSSLSVSKALEVEPPAN